MSPKAWFRLGIAVLCWGCVKVLGGCTLPDFNLPGNYILGGLFQIHEVNSTIDIKSRLPAALQCDKFTFLPSGYQQMQVFRFTVEEINNSSVLLPGLKLGYQIFDYCSDALNFRAALDFLSSNNSISLINNTCEVISVTGPYGSTETLTVAPLFMSYLVPMVSHVATSVQLRNRYLYPLFFRTIPSDDYQVKAIVRILQEFQWNWVAFFGSSDDYSQDALTVFLEEIKKARICLAYQGILSTNTSKYGEMFDSIASLNINVVILFTTIEFVVPFINVAISKNVQKVWIGSEAWSMDQDLIKETRIETIGVVLGTAIPVYGELPGFKEFVYRTMDRLAKATCSSSSNVSANSCNQACKECLSIDPNDIIDKDPTYNFPLYSAVYAIAHALHIVLQCELHSCNSSTPINPYMVSQALRQVNFTVFNKSMQFDDQGNPPARYSIVYWNWRSQLHTIIGSYSFEEDEKFSINAQSIKWPGNGTAPVLRCSNNCNLGYKRVVSGYFSCCWNCVICSSGTYINYTVDPYSCVPCQQDEWSDDGSVQCQKRNLDYLHITDPVSVGIVLLASIMVLSCVVMMCLFAYKHDTPVVRSAGGRTCLFLLTCLGLSSVSVYSFIGQPLLTHCILRNSVFSICYTACLSCLAVRSFQIFCVFKMAAKLPKAYEFWIKQNGQWVIISLSVMVQLFLCGLWVAVGGPKPVQIRLHTEIVFDCTLGNAAVFNMIIMFMGLLSVVCFFFAYMGTDLPKNYNEGKCITFSLLIFYISWTIFLTVKMTASEGNTSAVNAISILCSLYGIIYGYFFPKCYIILFKPDHNTAAYFQTSIQNYTLQSSST